MAYTQQPWPDLPGSVSAPLSSKMKSLEDGLHTAAAIADGAGGGGGDVITKLRYHPLSVHETEIQSLTVTPTAMAALSITNVSATTSIPSGATVMNATSAAAITAKLTPIGFRQADLTPVVAGYYGVNWRQNGSGAYSAANQATTPHGYACIVGGTRYVEFLGGMSVSGGIQARINGRRMTAAADAVTGAGSTNNKIKIDLGAVLSRAHIELLCHSSWSISKVFLDANGTIAPAPLTGQSWGYLSDSLGDVDTVTAGDHIDQWFSRTSYMIGAEQRFWDCYPGTGFGATVGGSGSTFILRALNSPIRNMGCDWLIVGTQFNDKSAGRSTGNVQADVTTTLGNIAGWPKVPKTVVLGVYNPAGDPTDATFVGYDNAAKAGAAAGGAYFISWLTGNIYNPSGTLLGNVGPVLPTAASASTAGLLFTDALHPSLAGHQYIALWMYNAIRVIIESLG